MSTNEMTGGEALVRMIQAHNGGPMFGMGGFQLLPFYDAARRLGLQHHLINDERAGVFAADAYAKVSGRVGYAVMSFGGFLGLGHSHYPLPWSALKYNTKLDGYETSVTEAQLRDAPAFSDDSWSDRNWETKTHSYYNAPPYW